VIAGFGIVVHEVRSRKQFNYSRKGHTLVGFFVFSMALIQATSGYLRPHLPKKSDSAEDVDVDLEDDETPKLKKTRFRVVWEVMHRVFGTATLALAWCNCNSGLHLYAKIFVTDNRAGLFWGLTGTLAGVIVILTLYSKCRRG
jgi:hypothetical protein